MTVDTHLLSNADLAQESNGKSSAPEWSLTEDLDHLSGLNVAESAIVFRKGQDRSGTNSAGDVPLLDSGERFRTLAETASDVILTVNEYGEIVFANSATTQVFGYSPEELLGKSMGILIPESNRLQHQTRLARYLETGQRQLSWESVQWDGLHRDGHIIPIELSLGEFFSNGHRYFTGIARDITDRRRSETLIAGQVQIFEMIATGQNLPAVLDRIARLIEDVAGNLRCVIFQLNAEGECLVVKAAPKMPKEFFDAFKILPIGMRYGTCGASIVEKEPQVSPDITCDSRWADFLELALSLGIRASWSTPVYDANRNPIGTISILYDKKHAPEPHEVDFVRVAAHLASIAIERACSEEKLRKSEARFRALIEKSLDGISLTDQHGRFVYVSPASCRILGYEPEEMIGKTAELRVHPDDWPILCERANALADKPGESDSLRYRVKHKNGSWIWLEVTLTNLLHEPSVQALIINFKDITQSKLAEDALRVSEERYRTLVTALDEGIILMDETATFLAANASAERILGLTAQQIVNRSLFNAEWEVIHEDGSPFQAQDFPAGITLKTGQPCSNVMMGVRTPYSQFAWISVNTRPIFREPNSKPYAVVISFTDITEHLRSEAELRDSEERFSTAFKSSPCAMALLTFPERKYVDVNDAWEQVFGYSLEEAVGKTSAELGLWLDPRQREEVNQQLTETGSVNNWEIWGQSKSGRQVVYLMAAEIVEFGARRHVLVSCYDITERKQTEQKLEQLYKQSRALSAKLESVREEERAHIAREVHDNLGQLMTGLKLDFSWLEKRLSRVEPKSLSQEVQPKLGEIASLLEDAIVTVRDIATGLRPGVLDTLGLRAAVDWQTREFERRTGIKCFAKLCSEPKGLPPERSTALFRILQEILTNITRHAKAHQARIELAKVEGEIRLTVTDDGVGISDDEIQNPQSLGLLGMRERAEIFGGSVSVTGQLGRGTKVTVRMPMKK